jgi:hypothetical protein
VYGLRKSRFGLGVYWIQVTYAFENIQDEEAYRNQKAISIYGIGIVGIEYTVTLNEISPNERSVIQKGGKTSICQVSKFELAMTEYDT